MQDNKKAYVELKHINKTFTDIRHLMMLVFQLRRENL